MSHAAAQEVEVTVEGIVNRLYPCPEHENMGDGEQHYDDAGQPTQNPNGYRHDCAGCAATPVRHETMETVVTRVAY